MRQGLKVVFLFVLGLLLAFGGSASVQSRPERVLPSVDYVQTTPLLTDQPVDAVSALAAGPRGVLLGSQQGYFAGYRSDGSSFTYYFHSDVLAAELNDRFFTLRTHDSVGPYLVVASWDYPEFGPFMFVDGAVASALTDQNLLTLDLYGRLSCWSLISGERTWVYDTRLVGYPSVFKLSGDAKKLVINTKGSLVTYDLKLAIGIRRARYLGQVNMETGSACFVNRNAAMVVPGQPEGLGGGLKLYSLTTGKLLKTMEGPAVRSVVAIDDRTVIAGRWDGKGAVVDIKTGESKVFDLPYSVHTMVYRPWLQQLEVAGDAPESVTYFIH